MIQELIQNRLQLLSPEYQEMLKGDFTSETASRFGAAHNFTDWQTIVLENGLVGYLLFFMNQSEFTAFVSRECEMNQDEAAVLVTAIVSLLPEGYRETHAYTYALFNGEIDPSTLTETTPTTTPENTVPQTNSQPSQPTPVAPLTNNTVTTQATANPIPAVRTMSGDIAATEANTPPTNIHAQTAPPNLPTEPANQEPTYTTSQEAILQNRSTVPTQPTSPNPSPAAAPQLSRPSPQPPAQTAQPNPTTPPTLAETNNPPKNTDEARWGSS